MPGVMPHTMQTLTLILLCSFPHNHKKQLDFWYLAESITNTTSSIPPSHELAQHEDLAIETESQNK